MTIIEFNEIIDFAVGREREAVQFYHDLQAEAKFAAHKTMLAEFENMEMGHIIMLENIRKNGVTDGEIKKTPNLKISEYISTEDAGLDLSYQNILIRAMKREEASTKLYTEMSRRFADPALVKLFTQLAAEESGHKYRFEKLYDEWMVDN
ncbi:MAG TPA: ferritin family protein [Candidatus Cloacimonadota bacterium]|nr:ferritin family protein [Candidatus Cloacimonadota bacterium]HPS38728.1 ferritin family protein [Candidatus Cloacimonadota bacterium]